MAFVVRGQTPCAAPRGGSARIEDGQARPDRSRDLAQRPHQHQTEEASRRVTTHPLSRPRVDGVALGSRLSVLLMRKSSAATKNRSPQADPLRASALFIPSRIAERRRAPAQAERNFSVYGIRARLEISSLTGSTPTSWKRGRCRRSQSPQKADRQRERACSGDRGKYCSSPHFRSGRPRSPVGHRS